MEKVKKQVKALRFGLLSPENIKKISRAKIVTPELYDIDGYPVDGGLMDLRMGAIDPGVRCRTCGGRLKECQGHPGSIELARPVLHIKYVPMAYGFLRGFCKDCGKILLTEEQIKKIRNPIQRLKKAKDLKKCPYCKAVQEKVRLDKPTTFYLGKRRIFPTEIREILSKIPDEDCRLVGVSPKTCRPEWAVLTLLLVPSVTTRPSITLESGERSEDDLTHKLSDIIRANQRLWENLNAGAPEVIIEDLWDLLQYHIITFFDNTITRIPPARHRSGQPLKTITERIKGKEGRIRHNLTGKRVNYSARTVISPDPSLHINEIGVPYEIAEVITVKEEVTSQNIELMRKLVLSKTYPGANYVIRPDGKRKRITEDLRAEIIEELEPGYFVERHLQDGDIVLFNRHPSLHKLSLMAHFVKVLPYKTFRLHPAATTPYNADFDGDEMNIHSPQNEEARIEAKNLMNVKENLMSPKNNSNLIGCISDAITGGYLLSHDTLSKGDAQQLLFESGKQISFNKKELSGNEIFSEILPDINHELKTKTEGKENLKIKNGNIISGTVDKYAFGVEDGILIKLIDQMKGRDVAFETIRESFGLGTKYLSKRGFTISLDDLNVNQKVKEMTQEIMKEAEIKTNKIIESYNNETLEIIPGKTLEESREIKIMKVLNEVRTKIGKIVKREFPRENPVNTMILSGAGGNILNITQISCVIGQQSLWSKRIELGYRERTLSHFRKKDLSPRARGFIYSSYIGGLNPCEFFFGAVTGRDALMDTALRTPKSGYLYRRLANALQDLKVEYDQTVRDASSHIVQFEYGGDGKDVANLHLKKDIQPGESIGIITAQSFGEPATQMALNVFHFAGVQEMQITQGLPRLIEIFDARKKPSTPAMEIYLNKQTNNEKDAKIIAEKIKEVKIKDVISEINIDFANKKIEIITDPERVRQIHVSLNTLVSRLKDKGFDVKMKDKSIFLKVSGLEFKDIYKLKEKLKETIISGVKGIEQVLIVKREKDYIILTAGSNLKEIVKFKGVDPDKTVTNDLYEVQDVFGIEVTRQIIINEISKVINSQGLDIDDRHLSLIADAICMTGQIKGVTRMGIISEKSSILARASFETPIKQFVNATIKASKDRLSSVIENIILNQPVPIGTGLPGLLVKVTGPLVKKEDMKSEKKKIIQIEKKAEKKKPVKKL